MVKRYGNCGCGYHGFLSKDRKCPVRGEEITDYHIVTNKHPSHFRDPNIEVR